MWSVQVWLQFSSLCSLLGREGYGSAIQEQGKTQVSAGTMVTLLVTWDVSVGSFPALPCWIWLAVDTDHRIVAVPCFGHVRCIGDSWVQVTLSGWCVSGVWRQSLQHLWGLFILWDEFRCWGCFLVGVCLIFLVFFTLWPGRAERVDSWPVIWMLSPQIVPGWMGAFLSQSPEGSAFETSLSLHLALLLVLSCSGMLWSYFWIWRGLSWQKVWQTDGWNGVVLFYS